MLPSLARIRVDNFAGSRLPSAQNHSIPHQLWLEFGELAAYFNHNSGRRFIKRLVLLAKLYNYK